MCNPVTALPASITSRPRPFYFKLRCFIISYVRVTFFENSNTYLKTEHRMSEQCGKARDGN